ncbi:MAG TPA: cytochrome c biogenesis protein CcdA, partial [Tissierellales bacterium]|nr:cytochrome c biogenesis protein CcdA [Tissierellales bacterium]
MEHMNIFVVFLEGILSLFSPCVLSILPIYLAILSGSSVQNLKDGEVKLKDSPLVRNTVLFVLGISTTFFILGSSVRV